MRSIRLFILLTFSALMVLEAYDFSDETDRQALLEFKSQVSQARRVVLSSWNNSFLLCNWKGVTCGRKHKRVTHLDLQGLQLDGVISPSVGNLSFLVSLNLSNNSFGGIIPPEVGNLFRLKYLDMNSNDLGGGIPASLSNCSELLALKLESNHLGESIPSELGSLSKLVKLYLADNNLKGKLPSSLGNLTSLIKLIFRVNNMEGEIPTTLSNILTLQTLSIEHNKLTGRISPTLGKLWNLQTLYLEDNSLGSNSSGDFEFIDALTNCTHLKHLNVAQNRLRGKLPTSIANLSKELTELGLNENYISGSILHDIGNLISLRELWLMDNLLTGPLPTSLGMLSNLQLLYLYSNRLSGEIPSSIGNITRLESLFLSNNRFEGIVPPSLGKLRNLQRLYLNDNSLGSYSSRNFEFLVALTNCTLIKLVNAAENMLRGELPTSIGNLISLQDLQLMDNLLMGRLPTSLGKLSNLGFLSLSSNELFGEIPSSIGNITGLAYLYLSNNNFEGIVPPSLGNCNYLNELAIDYNKLNGTIPPGIMLVLSLVHLRMDGNSLSGSLPREVGQLQHLLTLSLGNNKLSGILPQELGKCLSLEDLDLHKNSFDGVVPDIRGLLGVKYIDFSNNNLSGSIPEYFENFSSLQYMNLSFNNFEGKVPTKGIFQNSSIVFLFGNGNLCGGIKDLKLKPCPMENKHSFFLKKVVIGVSICTALLLILFIVSVSLRWFRKRKKNQNANNPIPSTLEVFHDKISYGDIQTATNGFSPSNLIGSGSFGTVFKAFLPTVNKVIAVKVLNLKRHGAMKSFMAECESLKDIRHRNLVKLLTTCSSIDFQGNEFRALIYEFMPNGSLDVWLHTEEVEEVHKPSRTLTLFEKLNIAIDVASVLDYLHIHCHKPIAHCDLKPSNVLLDNDFTAHVSDFGLARLLKFDHESYFNQLSSAGIRGTIGYAAPEYGMGGQPSIHGDMYSFGVLVLEMFTGKRPINDLFGESFTLHSYTKSALPERVLDIADKSILQVGRRVGFPVAECLTLVLVVGLKCCEEIPTNRMATSEARKELISIRERFFKARC